LNNSARIAKYSYWVLYRGTVSCSIEFGRVMGPVVTGFHVAESRDGLGFLPPKIFFRYHAVIRRLFGRSLEDEGIVVYGRIICIRAHSQCTAHSNANIKPAAQITTSMCSGQQQVLQYSTLMSLSSLLFKLSFVRLPCHLLVYPGYM